MKDDLCFENLDQIESYMKKEAPTWILRRGKNNIHNFEKHSQDYEVLQVFKYDTVLPFAEFWKGFYSFLPEYYSGHYGLAVNEDGNFYFTCVGDLNFAMKKVISSL